MKYTLEIVESVVYRDGELPIVLTIKYTTETGYVGEIRADKVGMTREKIVKLVEEDIKQVGSLHKATLGA